MTNNGFFGWIRQGVKQSVLLGVSDALDALGTVDSNESFHPSIAKAIGTGAMSLGPIDALKFDLTSSDVGQFVMNTPAYFAMDRIEFSTVPEPSSMLLAASLGCYGVVRRLRSRGNSKSQVQAGKSAC
jgi:hypothetical protein